MGFPNTDWPGSIDTSEDRTDSIDVVWASDFEYQDAQIRQIQTWLGTTGSLIGDGVASAGPSGMVSPISSGGDAFTLAARNAFAAGQILVIGDDYDNTLQEKLRLDYQGILWTLAGADLGTGSFLRIPHGNTLPVSFDEARLFYKDDENLLYAANGTGWEVVGSDFDNASFLRIPHGNALPGTFEEARLFYKDDEDTLYAANGSTWNAVGVASVRASADIIIGNTAAGDVEGQTCDYLDADNGLVLKTQIEAAPANSLIFIRPGTYDFNAAGGPDTRIVVPAGCVVVGAGRGVSTIKTQGSGTPSNFTGTAFYLNAGAVLMDLSIEVTAPTAQGDITPSHVVQLFSDAEAHRVDVSFASGWSLITMPPQSFYLSFDSVFYLNGTGTHRLVDCTATSLWSNDENGGNNRIGAINIFGGDVTYVDRCFIEGSDRSVEVTNTRAIITNSYFAEAYDRGIYLNNADGSRIVGNTVIMNETSTLNYAIYTFNLDRCSIIGNHLEQLQGGLGNYAIYLNQTNNCVVSGNTGNGGTPPGAWDNIVNMPSGSDENIFVANNFGGGADYNDPSGDNTVIVKTSGDIFSIETARYDYTQQAAPVEVVVGQFMFDASVIPIGGEAKFRCMVNPTFNVAGVCRVRVYDIGAPGSPAAPLEITDDLPSGWNLETSSSGQQYIETADLNTHPTTRSIGTIVEAQRMYEVTIIQSSQENDTVDLGFAGIYVNIP